MNPAGADPVPNKGSRFLGAVHTEGRPPHMLFGQLADIRKN